MKAAKTGHCTVRETENRDLCWEGECACTGKGNECKYIYINIYLFIYLEIETEIKVSYVFLYVCIYICMYMLQI